MPRKFNVLSLLGKETIRYSNLPERYIKRAMEQIYYKTPPGPQYQKKIYQREKFLFKTDRPWTMDFLSDNKPGKIIRPIRKEPILNWSFFIGDRVEVLIGKDRGKQGTVKQIIQERNWVIVEGLNTELKTIGKNKQFDGVLIKKEKPLLVTDQVALVDPSDLCPTEIKWQYTEEGTKVRVSTRTGRIIPIPLTAESTMDYKFKINYTEGPKDTLKEDVAMITFQPQLKTFEMDIMDKMGIKEDRIQKESFWY